MTSEDELMTRIPMQVKKAYCFRLPEHLAIYVACPRCGHMLLREYSAFCSNCGQALSWKGFNLDAVELVELF